MRSISRRAIRTGLVLSILAGCTPRVASMIPDQNLQSAAAPNTALYRNILLGEVGGGEEPNPLFEITVGADDFHQSLLQALDRQGFLSDQKGAPFQLKAYIIEVKHPRAAFSITVDSFVRYTLIRVKDGSSVFDDVLQGTFTAGVVDAFFGIERLRIAEEGSIRANISALLGRLQAAAIQEKAR